MKVGVPRALYYYEYGDVLVMFLRYLGCEAVLSSPREPKVLPRELFAPADGACLPVKVFLSHVKNLLEGDADAVLVPRTVKCTENGFTCPKVIGVPELVKYALRPQKPVIVTELRGNLGRFLSDTGRALGFSYSEVKSAVGRALVWRDSKMLFTDIGSAGAFASRDGGGCVVLLGRKYLTEDVCVNSGIAKKLKKLGHSTVSADVMEGEALLSFGERSFQKLPFWASGEQCVSLAAMASASRARFDGIIYLSAFGCGPDSFVIPLIKRYLRDNNEVAFLEITLDEHTGEAGLDTRLEAFSDMVKRGAYV